MNKRKQLKGTHSQVHQSKFWSVCIKDYFIDSRRYLEFFKNFDHFCSLCSHALWDNFNERVPRERSESNAAAAMTPVAGEVDVETAAASENSGWKSKLRCCCRRRQNQVTIRKPHSY